MFTETLIRIPFIVIGRFTPASTPHWLSLKCADVYLSQAAFGIQIVDLQKKYSSHDPVNFITFLLICKKFIAVSVIQQNQKNKSVSNAWDNSEFSCNA